MPEMSDYLEVFAQRREALSKLLGPADEAVMTPAVPIYLGGSAEVLTFRGYVKGVTYVTAGLTGGVADVPQVPNRKGEYELMICTPTEEPRAAKLISMLSRYTLEAELNPGETMGCPPISGSEIKALLFAEPEVRGPFELRGKQYGLLLCVGITGPELDGAMKGSSEELLAAMKQENVFPFTDFARKTLKPPRRGLFSGW
jgi:hypothetical protein